MVSICHELKAIYIHTPKVGGLYIEQILSKYYNFKTHFFTRPDHNKFNEKRKSNLNGKCGVLNIVKKGIIRYYQTPIFKYITEEQWDTYYKFAFIRNPYDRFISAYEYLNKNNNITGISNLLDFADKKDSITDYSYFHTFVSQYDQLLNNKNELDINYLGNFENLNKDLITILTNIGVKQILHNDYIINNTIINSSKKKEYPTYYSDELIQKINMLFNDDFTHFKYKKCENIEELIEDSKKYNITEQTIIENNKLIINTTKLNITLDSGINLNIDTNVNTNNINYKCEEISNSENKNKMQKLINILKNSSSNLSMVSSPCV